MNGFFLATGAYVVNTSSRKTRNNLNAKLKLQS